ncbi:ABC transporter permease [Williamsoniiplasma lucivorax]|uniref:ABC transporter permease n=1 Tax=Williamsoniiplasma lucivorax TaxID=209274 RepID=A0A2S5RDR0_9MOLU|nr:ABC transporter permease [Williamsoniiplasma lucivorax]PPE05456.1 ABC transporter permease [Williamsoniiplasma lucivorax]
MKNNFSLIAIFWKIQWNNYKNDYASITLGFVLTTIMVFCWLMFKPKNGLFTADPFILASGIGITTIRNAQYNLSNVLGDWRFKGTLTKLKQTPLSKGIAFFSILAFNWAINFVIITLIFIMGMMFPEQRRLIQFVDWTVFLSGLFLHIIMCSLLGMLLQFWIKSRDWKQVFCLVCYFGAMYLLGLGIPWKVVGNVPWLNYLLYIAPQRYTITLMQSGWIGKAYPNLGMPVVGDGKWHMGDGHDFPGSVDPDSFLASAGFGFGHHLWLVYLAIFAWFALICLIIYWGYRRQNIFNSRGIKSYQGVNKRILYINQIKKTQSLTELNQVINQINLEAKNEKEKLKIKNARYKKPKKVVR